MQQDAAPHIVDEIVVRIQQGDAKAFRTLFNDYYSRLCSYAIRYVRYANDAEEIVQRVFVKIHEKKEKWNPQNVERFLFTSVRNEALNYLRDKKVWQPLEKVESRPLPSPGIQEDMMEKERLERLLDAVHSLPKRQKECILLRWHYELTFQDIADALKISRKTVDNHIDKAKKKLKMKLGV